MKRWIHGSSKKTEQNLDGVVSWNGYYYGAKRTKDGTKYYKAHTSRFDDTFGGTEEITYDEYDEAVEKYSRISNRWNSEYQGGYR